MSKDTRKIAESPVYQGEDEVFPYSFDSSDWPAGTRSNPAILVMNQTTDVTSDICTDGPDVSGTDITFTLANLTVGVHYFVRLSWDVGTATYSTFGTWIGQA